MTEIVWVKMTALIAACLFAQVTVLNQIIVLGVHPDVMVLLPVVAATLGGAERGATVGFCAGLAADLAVSLPFGLSALTFVLVGFALGMFCASPIGRDLASTRAVISVIGAATVTAAYAVFGALLGQPGMLSGRSAAAVLVVAIGAAVMGRPMFLLVRWALSGSGSAAGHGLAGGRSVLA